MDNPQKPLLSGCKICFTRHSLERFRKRFPKYARKGVKKGALQLLLEARERGAISEESRAIRASRNNISRIRYFRIGQCRFVLQQRKNNQFVVITIERVFRE